MSKNWHTFLVDAACETREIIAASKLGGSSIKAGTCKLIEIVHAIWRANQNDEGGKGERERKGRVLKAKEIG